MPTGKDVSLIPLREKNSNCIGIDVQWAANAATGIGKYTKRWLLHLAELDSIHWYVLFGSGEAATAGELRDLPSKYGNFIYVRVHTHCLPHRLAMVTRDQWLLPWVARTYGCSLLFFPYFNPAVQSMSSSLVTITDLDIYLHRRRYSPLKRLYYNLLLRYAAQHALGFVAISQATKSDAVTHLGIAPEHIHVVYPGVAEHFRSIARAEARRWCAEHYQITTPFVLYTGGYAVRKNISTTLNAFRRACSQLDAPLHLVLTGPADRDATVRACLEDRRDSHVILVGSVPEGELPYLYSAAALLLYPTLYEGFGLPIVEAQACGTPVITSNTSSMPEVAGHAAILVNPLDEEDIANAIVRMLTDVTLREYLSIRGLKNARRFTWRAGAAKLLALFNEYEQRTISR